MLASALHALRGPLRAVPVLGVTQIVAWGALYYAFALLAPRIVEDTGWSKTLVHAGYSLALLASGLAAPLAGRLVDQVGGRVLMSFGSALAGAGLLLLASAHHPVVYLAAWAVIGVAMTATLYDPAFATLTQLFGTSARRKITALTLAGGFASTVFWPLTHVLLGSLDWRGVALAYAVLQLGLCLPLHAFGLPSRPAETATRPEHKATTGEPLLVGDDRRLAFILLAVAFSTNSFVFAGLSVHVISMMDTIGLGTATAVAVAALVGPAQVAARIVEFVAFQRLHAAAVGVISAALVPLAFVVLALAGGSTAAAILFALLYGASNGLLTIVRGAVPLALFGVAGYGAVLGRLGAPVLLAKAAAPLAFAIVIERAGVAGGIWLSGLMVTASFIAMLWIWLRFGRPDRSV